METKQCYKCEEIKPLTDFRIKKNPRWESERIDTRCKKCDAKYKKEYYYKKLNKDKNYFLDKHREYKKRCPWARRYNTIKARCSYGWYADHGIKFFLKIKDIKFLWFRDKSYLLKHPSIDRINNKGNYVLDNCHFIELSENCRNGGLNRWKYVYGRKYDV